MKKVIMHKWQSCRTGTWGWSLNEVWNDWDHVYSDPYYVEIPENFELAETVTGEEMYFADGDRRGYEIVSFSDHENCIPYFVGGSPVKTIRLHVLGPAEEE